jgi:hypothetical protein
MVIEKNYQRVLDIFIEKNGNKPVEFFAVLKMDELIDKWSVLLAADWVTEENRKETFNMLVSILIDTLNPEEIAEVARVGVMPTSVHLVEVFLDKFQAGQYIKEDARINGNVIHEGYIIKCSTSRKEL